MNYLILLLLLILFPYKEGIGQNSFKKIYSNQFSCEKLSFDLYYYNDIRRPEETDFKPTPVLYPTKYYFNKSDTNELNVNLKDIEWTCVDSLINISGEIILDSINHNSSWDSMPIVIVGTLIHEPYEFKDDSHYSVKIIGAPLMLDAYFIKNYSFYYINTSNFLKDEVITFKCKLKFQKGNDVLIIAKKGYYSVIYNLKEIVSPTSPRL